MYGPVLTFLAKRENVLLLLMKQSSLRNLIMMIVMVFLMESLMEMMLMDMLMKVDLLLPSLPPTSALLFSGKGKGH